jgi:hypothetical protein
VNVIKHPVILGSPDATSHQDNDLHEESHTKLSPHPIKNLEDSPSGWDSSTNSLPTSQSCISGRDET